MLKAAFLKISKLRISSPKKTDFFAFVSKVKTIMHVFF